MHNSVGQACLCLATLPASAPFNASRDRGPIDGAATSPSKVSRPPCNDCGQGQAQRRLTQQFVNNMHLNICVCPTCVSCNGSAMPKRQLCICSDDDCPATIYQETDCPDIALTSRAITRACCYWLHVHRARLWCV